MARTQDPRSGDGVDGSIHSGPLHAKNLAVMPRDYLLAVVRGMLTAQPSAYGEALSGKWQQSKHAARSFRVGENVIATVYLRAQLNSSDVRTKFTSVGGAMNKVSHFTRHYVEPSSGGVDWWGRGLCAQISLPDNKAVSHEL